MSDTPTPDLDAFMEGFSDGRNERPRKKNKGRTYLRAYKAGAEARVRALPVAESGTVLSRSRRRG